jgi:hypothetical protein
LCRLWVRFHMHGLQTRRSQAHVDPVSGRFIAGVDFDLSTLDLRHIREELPWLKQLDISVHAEPLLQLLQQRRPRLAFLRDGCFCARLTSLTLNFESIGHTTASVQLMLSTLPLVSSLTALECTVPQAMSVELDLSFLSRMSTHTRT